MIDRTISHYRILGKLGEVRKSPTSVFLRVVVIFRIPLKRKREARRMIGQTSSHYKILDKLGEVPKSPTSDFSPKGPKGIPLEDASPRVVATLIPLCGTPLFGGRGRSILL